jgi:hypothetical protein
LSVTPFTRAVFSVNPPGILEVLSCVTCPLLFLLLLDHLPAGFAC